MNMSKNHDQIKNYYDSAAATYSEHYNLDNLKTGKKYPQNYYRLNMILHRMKESRIKSVYEVGVGEGTPLAMMAKEGYETAGCDISSQMVALTREKFTKMGLDPKSIQEGNIEKIETIENQIAVQKYDSVIAFGVMPHVDNDETAINNIKSILNPNGRVFIEFRNKLFSLFTFNRFTKEFILDDLLSNVSGDVQDLVSKDLDKRLELSQPPLRKNEDGTSYDLIQAKYHNPFEVVDFMEKENFSEIKLHWYHYHSAPPMLESEAKLRIWDEASKLEGSSDWRGHFLCSAFVLEALYSGDK
jgi:2-polyprenyl-3-methyl-5-hydroxy-6-metoxy-1,4-benzoquinol methylase